MKYLLGLLLFLTHCINGETLPFKAGDAAVYTISQQCDMSAVYLGWYKDTIHSDCSMDVEVTLLSAGYPYEVEVTLKKVVIFEEVKRGVTKKTSYDSSAPQTDDKLSNYFKTLIDRPMRFIVEGDFMVQETTGYLSDDFFHFGGTAWTYQLFLTQLFQLSGEDLILEQSYPVSCYQLLNWEDEQAVKESDLLMHKGEYVIGGIDSENIESRWEGHVISDDGSLKTELVVFGNVSWDKANPLVQQRELDFRMKQGHKKVTAGTKFKLKQTWSSSLKL